MEGKDEPLPDLLITSGGNGISPTDQTVEVIAPYLDVQLPHVMTAVLLEGLNNTPLAALSRGLAGVAGDMFIATLPGPLGGGQDGMTALDDLIDHIAERTRREDQRRLGD